MSANITCPRREYQKLLTGIHPDNEQLTELLDHLEHCPECASSLPDLRQVDTLVQPLAGATWQRPCGEEDVVEQLMAQLTQLGSAEDSAISSSDPTQFDSPADDPLRELLALLAPPQDSGEIGRLGTYRVLKLLGHGGMGAVFLAEDARLKRLVAVKVMRPQLIGNSEARRRFEAEARAMAAVEHEHIVPILHIGEERGIPYLVMPFLRGESLADRLRREGKLAPAEAVRIARTVALGLQAAHDQGLIHRDVKPANVWLEEAGTGTPRLKLLDFGLVRITTPGTPQTSAGILLGTPGYMAPEQLHGGTTDVRTDLFGLGCVLYRMLTGREAFTGAYPVALLLAVEREAPPAPHQIDPAIPRRLSDLVQCLLAKAPQDRPQSAAAVIRALDDPSLLAVHSGELPLPGNRPAVKNPVVAAKTKPEARQPQKAPGLRLTGRRWAAILLAQLQRGAAFDGTDYRSLGPE